MQKILIVDDEPFIAKTIQFMIEASDQPVTVCGIANNGLQALELVQVLEPDIVMTDIKMPVMNGLKLVEALSKLPAPPLSIILSGYGEFDYAKSAFKAGVFDYLLKPIDSDALTDVLTKATHALSDAHKRMLEEAIQNLLSSSHELIDEPTLTKYFSNESFAFMMMNAGSYYHFSYSPAPSYFDWWENDSLTSLLPDLSEETGWMISGIRPNERILLYATDNPESYFEGFKELYHTLSKQSVPVHCTYGIHVGSIGTLNKTISNHRLLLNRNAIFGQCSLILPDMQEPTDKNKLIFSKEDKSKLQLLLETGNKQAILNWIREMVLQSAQKKGRQIDLQFYLLEILYLLDETLPVDKQDHEDLLYFVIDIINTCCTYEDLIEHYLKIANELLLRKDADSTISSPKDLICNVKKYIEEHYSENINLQKIADVFGFVPPYLSRVFKKEIGVSPSDYILNLKIERIKYLLSLEPRLSLKMIAENTGFNDSFYMSKVFKLATGVSPSEYRSNGNSMEKL